MRTFYAIVEDKDVREYEIKELREEVKTISDVMDFIITIHGEHRAALDCLKENGIQSRLNDFLGEEGMNLISELRELRASLEIALDDATRGL